MRSEFFQLPQQPEKLKVLPILLLIAATSIALCVAYATFVGNDGSQDKSKGPFRDYRRMPKDKPVGDLAQTACFKECAVFSCLRWPHVSGLVRHLFFVISSWLFNHPPQTLRNMYE